MSACQSCKSQPVRIMIQEEFEDTKGVIMLMVQYERSKPCLLMVYKSINKQSNGYRINRVVIMAIIVIFSSSKKCIMFIKFTYTNIYSL